MDTNLTPVTTEQLDDMVLEFIRQRDFVSFVELTRFLEPYIPTKGLWGVSADERQNVLAWSGMSDEYSALVDRLRKSRRIETWTCSSLLVYIVDGGMLDLPRATQFGTKSYKKPHWLPVTIRIAGAGTKKERAAGPHGVGKKGGSRATPNGSK